MPKLAVLGQPVSHSRSPAMHTAALGSWGWPESGATRRSRCARRIRGAVRALPAEGFAGVNVTVPHKLAALAVADQLVARGRRDRRREHAHLRRRRDRGREHRRRRHHRGARRRAVGQRALVLGAGGSARAAVWALRRRGRRRVGLEPDRREGRGARGRARGDGDLHGGGSCRCRFDMVVNATTVGLEAANPAPGSRLGLTLIALADLKALPVRCRCPQRDDKS